MKRTQFFTRKMLVGTIMAACLLLGTNVFAQSGNNSGNRNDGGRGPGGKPPIQQLDTNQDGQLSQEEFLAEFNRLDQNQDGQIEASEAPGKPPRGPQDQQEGQANGRPERGPQNLQEDRSGARPERGPEGRGEDRRGGRGEGPQGGPREGFIAHFDQNDDGTVSQAEFLADFSRLDQNQNGVIEESELPQGPPQGPPPADGSDTPVN